MMTYSHYVDIVGHRPQRDEANQDIDVPYVKLGNVPCRIESVTGGEVRRGEQMQDTTNKRIEMHFQDQFPIETTDLLREKRGDKVVQEINIVAVYDPDGLRRKLVVQGRV
jgi:head-tail adaptor